ncbi:velvet domain-containing protein [Favolaschia claudopus]|uniref:Velvet domain-containing protein n=1 Tax=Favolaschia claudopus TaxID=2862362 RepID=A0AAW0C4E0_9AGAR
MGLGSLCDPLHLSYTPSSCLCETWLTDWLVVMMRRQYELTVRQEPKQARMCGIGGKADRRPIDPPVIVQLRVIDPAVSSSQSSSGSTSNSDPAAVHDDLAEPPYTSLTSYAQSFLQNPYYFMFASLAKPDDDTELHWLKDGRTRCTTGSVVSSLYALKDPTSGGSSSASTSSEAKKDNGPTTVQPATDAGFFVFPDLSVRTEGSYRLKLSLFEVVGNDVRHCKSIYSAPFYVYTAKKFPGVEESSPLTCSLADQGIKIRIRKDIRMRKARQAAQQQGLHGSESRGLIEAGPSSSSHHGSSGHGGMPTVDSDGEGAGKERDRDKNRPAKRARTDTGDATGNGGASDLGPGGVPPVGTPWPSGPLIPPPPGAAIEGGGRVSCFLSIHATLSGFLVYCRSLCTLLQDPQTRVCSSRRHRSR